MRNFFQRSAGRMMISIIIVYFLIVLMVFLWALQVTATVTRDDPARAPVLIFFSLIFPAMILVLTTAGFIRIYRQRRAGIPGGLLRRRFVGSFSLAVLFSSLPVILLLGIFVETAVSSWLAPSNGQALKSGEGLGRTYYNEALNRLETFAGSSYFESLLDSGDMNLIWEGIQDVAPYVHALQTDGPEDSLRIGSPDLFRSSFALEDASFTGTLPRQIRENGTLISWQTTVGEVRVVLSTLLPMEFEQRIRRISYALGEWERYDRLETGVGRSILLFGLLLAAPLIFMALLLGLILSERIVRPLVMLSQATGKIAEGDYSFRVMTPGGDDLIFLTESFNRMIRELEVSRTKILQTEKVAAWQVIAHRLAHELRNPLTPIKLSAQRVRRKADMGKLDEQTAIKSMDLVIREVEGLDKLLQDFREFAGGSQPELTRLNLSQLAEEVLERFRSADEVGIRWRFFSSHHTVDALGDSHQIRQTLVNLLQNAVEAGAGEVTMRLDKVRRGTAPYVRIQIRDNGEGIAPERASAVFQPYDSTRDRGSGLGLAVVQRIIYDHRGRIWFESEPEIGTVFYIDLPAGENS